MIKPVQLTTAAQNITKSVVYKLPSTEQFVKEAPLVDFRTFMKAQNGTREEISLLKQLLQSHQSRYEKIRNSLNKNFGSDWVFCYQDLNDKQSDMYIACIDEQESIMQITKIIDDLQSKLPRLNISA